MRICLYTVTALPKLGGQEAVVDALAREYLAAGHEPTVMAPRPRLPLRPDDASLPYPVLRHPRFYSTTHLVGWYRRWLRRAHRRERFDVIHCHDVYPTGYVAALLREQLKIPLVITSHGGDVRDGNVRLSKPGLRRRFEQAVRTADALVSIGPFTDAGFGALHADPAKLHTIPNGVHLGPLAAPVARPAGLSPAIQPGGYALFLGRLALRKGLDVLLAAAALASPSLHWVIAGSGAERAAIEQQIAAAGLNGRVHLVGRVTGETKAYLLQNALAAVMPSRGWEAFPLVVLESFAAGRPVVASCIPGLEDVIAPEQTGLLVPPESPAALAAALDRLAADRVFADHLGRAAATHAAGFDWPLIAQKHLTLYESLRSPLP